MNAFILAYCTLVIAQLHSDAHVVKMPLEAVQVLFSAVRIAGATIKGKASTHERHPLVRWAACHRSHMKFMFKLALALFAEYVRRYNKKETDPADIKNGHVERLKEVIYNSEMPHCIPGGDPPDAMDVHVWDDANTARARREWNEKEAKAQAEAEAAGERRRKRRATPPCDSMVLATADLPEGIKCFPLCMPKKYHVFDTDGSPCCIASYQNYYYHEKLNGTSIKSNMYTYNQVRKWPEPFDNFKDVGQATMLN